MHRGACHTQARERIFARPWLHIILLLLPWIHGSSNRNLAPPPRSFAPRARDSSPSPASIPFAAPGALSEEVEAHMGHDMLRPDHYVVPRSHDLALRQANCVPLDDLLDVGLREGGGSCERAVEERSRPEEGGEGARSEVEHRAIWCLSTQDGTRGTRGVVEPRGERPGVELAGSPRREHRRRERGVGTRGERPADFQKKKEQVRPPPGVGREPTRFSQSEQRNSFGTFPLPLYAFCFIHKSQYCTIITVPTPGQSPQRVGRGDVVSLPVSPVSSKVLDDAFQNSCH